MLKRIGLAALAMSLTAGALSFAGGAPTANANLIIDGYYSCPAGYPWQANTIIGNGDHTHWISYMTIHYLRGGFTNNKTIWPTDAAHKITGSWLHHQLFNTQDPTGTGSVYCRIDG